MPSPTQVVALLKSQNIHHVRLYDADASLLAALANTGIRVVVSVPNEQLLAIGSSNATAAAWVARNVAAHFPAVNISAIAVGSEVLTSMPNAAPLLLPAIRFLQSALVASNLDKSVKVSPPMYTHMHTLWSNVAYWNMMEMETESKWQKWFSTSSIFFLLITFSTLI